MNVEPSTPLIDHPAHFAPAYWLQLVLRKELACGRQRTQLVAYGAADVAKRASLTKLRTLVAFHNHPFKAREVFCFHGQLITWRNVLAEPLSSKRLSVRCERTQGLQVVIDAHVLQVRFSFAAGMTKPVMYEASLPLVAHLEPHRLTTLAATARLVGDLTPLVMLFTAADSHPHAYKNQELWVRCGA